MLQKTERNPIEKKFFKFVLPSMFTMLLGGFYTIVDGFFVGHAVGDVGLAGIGLVWPVTAVLMALGMGIGVGGSVLMSTARGAGEHEKADQARANTLVLLILASVACTVLLLLLNPLILRGLGAEGQVYTEALSYIQVVSLGGSMSILSSGFIPILRNSHQTLQAMTIMTGGLLTNCALDYLFLMVLPWGLRGAALATILGQAVTVVLSVLCLLRQREHKIKRRDFILDARIMGNALKIGASPFGLTLMPSLITVFNNWQCLAYGGTLAVSAYSVVNYLLASVLLLLEGVGEGMQPMISFLHGAGDDSAMIRVRSKGLVAVISFSVAFLLATIPLKTLLPIFFATSQETAAIIHKALPILAVAFPMMGLGKLFTSFFYACGETRFSTLLVYADPVLFTPLCITILPRFFGLTGVWYALPGAQSLIMLLLTVLLIRHKMKLGKKIKEVATV